MKNLTARAFFQSSRGLLVAVTLLVFLLGACSSDKSDKKSAAKDTAEETTEADAAEETTETDVADAKAPAEQTLQGEGDLAGAKLIVPAEAYAGTQALSLKEGSMPLLKSVDGHEVLEALGPAVEFGPEGTVFSQPVTVQIPFSKTAYNELSTSDKGLAIVVKMNDSAQVKLDVGPMAIDYIELDVGPMAAGDAIIHSNQGKYDAVLEFSTNHFSTYQVVALAIAPSSECSETCPIGTECGKDGNCTSMPCNGTSDCPDASFECPERLDVCVSLCVEEDNNQVPLNAKKLGTEKKTFAQLCPLSEVDWYQFSLKESDALLPYEVTIHFPGGIVRVDVFPASVVTDPETPPLKTGDTPFGAKFSLKGSASPGATYYVRVEANDETQQTPGFNEYDISINH